MNLVSSKAVILSSILSILPRGAAVPVHRPVLGQRDEWGQCECQHVQTDGGGADHL